MPRIKLLSSGYWHVRWNKYRWFQWPKWRYPTMDDGFGWANVNDLSVAIGLVEEEWTQKNS